MRRGELKTAPKHLTCSRTTSTARSTSSKTFRFAGEAVRHRRGPLRRVLLSRVSYHLYYAVDAKSQIVNILALWHTSRGSKPRL
jgi:hypothetical protein